MFNRDFIVVELANILAGPVTGMFFAELGARVIKLENPHTGGDATRGWKLAGEPDDTDTPAYFCCANWGKESLACDFNNDAGRQVAHALAARADVVIASFKPGDDRKLGLDYDSLAALNPDLIYGQITAYGADDPRPGFDAILQAEAGFTYLNGEPDGPPTKMPVALIDLLAAHQLKEGLLLALIKRIQGGGGSRVMVSLLEAGVASLANQATNYLVGNTVPQRMGSEHPNIVPYGSILRCGDDHELVIAAATERQYRGLMEALGLGTLAADERFANGQQRVRHRDALLAAIREAAAATSATALAERLTAAKVPFGHVNDMAAVFTQPGAQRLVLGTPGEVAGVRSLAIKGSATADVAAPAPPPHLDQHRADVLGSVLGYDDDEQDALARAGAFGTRSNG